MPLFTLLATAGAAPFASAPARVHTLTLLVERVSNSKGVVGVLVFHSPQGWPEDNARAFRAVAVPANPGLTVVRIPNLPEGAYAVVVLHDENENRKLDRNWLGVPKEQWGMSNNPRVYFLAPSFGQARFAFTQDQQMRIRLH